MTHQEILEEAIQKAIDGGWTAEFTAKDAVRVWVNKSTEEMIDFKPVEHVFNQYINKDIIFDHDFAKALWGEGGDTATGFMQGNEVMVGTTWRHHLQQMVIADDPIEYLGKNL